MNDRLKMVRLACMAGLVVTVGVIAALPLVLVSPSSRSGAFCFQVLWAEALGVAAWGSLYAFLAAPLSRSEPKRGIGRIAPAVAGVVMGYAVLSLALLVASSVLPNADWLPRVHLAVQIVLAAATLISILLMSIAVLYGQRDTAPTQPPPPTTFPT